MMVNFNDVEITNQDAGFGEWRFSSDGTEENAILGDDESLVVPGGNMLFNDGQRAEGLRLLARAVSLSRRDEIVRRAHAAAVAAVAPGATLADVHQAAHDVLIEGMREQRLIGQLDASATAERAKAFFPHRTSHWLGLDVHDVGDYVVGGAPRRLEDGMVLTIEPGLYVPFASDAPESLRGIGIRIEDDVLVSGGRAVLLSGALPVDAEALESLVRGES
jgi:hypothetical protein